MKKISLRKRFEVLKRCKFACSYCGARPPEATIEIDHIIAVANGGDNSIENLTAACKPCNLGKSDIPLSILPVELEQKAIEASERKPRLKAIKSERARIDDACHIVAFMYMDATRDDSIPRPFRKEIRSFVNALPVDVVINAMRESIAKTGRASNRSFDTFRKACRDALLPA